LINTGLFLAIPVIILSFLRLMSYGSWAWRQGYRRGAVGVYVVAAVSLVVPLVLLLRSSQ